MPTMSLFECGNQYIGVSYVRVYVWASDKERALELAREKFLSAGQDAKKLGCTLLFDGSSGEFCTSPSDEGWER